MTDSMATTRMIQPAGATRGPLAVGERRHREKRQPPLPTPQTKTDRPLTDQDQERDDAESPGRAIDIRI